MMIIYLLLVCGVASGFQDPSSCSSSQFYDYITHTCRSCPSRTAAADVGYCNCTGTSYSTVGTIGFNHADSCTDGGSTPSGEQIYALYDRDGTFNPQLLTCAGYPDPLNQQCIPCGFGMTYNSADGICECPSSHYLIGQACLQYTETFVNPFPSDVQQRQAYDKAYVGCYINKHHDSCQILLNRCAANNYQSNFFCTLLQETITNYNQYGGLPVPQTDDAPEDELSIYASSLPGTNSTTIQNQLQFYVIEYSKTGWINDIKPMRDQLIPCPSTEEDVISLQSFGLGTFKQCKDGDLKSGNSDYFYDVFVLEEGKLAEVPIYLNQTTPYYKRISQNYQYNSIDVEFVTNPPLRVPYISLYPNETSAQIETSSSATSISITVQAPFIVFNVFLLFVFIYNFYRYMKYNPNETNDPYFCFKAIFIFLMMGVKHWGIGLWIWLFGTSAYVFCFFKFQQEVYLMLPDQYSQSEWFAYYHPFMSAFYSQMSFIILSIFSLIYDMSSSTDYFLIDWEKEKSVGELTSQKKPVSVWRKVLLVNQLYELTVNRVMDVEFVMLFSLVFLESVGWINLSYEIPNTLDVTSDKGTVKNAVLAYFIITFVIFTIGVLQYIIRHLLKIWAPLPYENFLDLCSLTNISLIIFDEALHGYYLHGMNPLGQSEGDLNAIESIFEKQAKSFGINRGFRNDDPQKYQAFEVVFPLKLRAKFQEKYKGRYLQKLIGKAYDPSLLAEPVPTKMEEQDYSELQMIHTEMLDHFKYNLESVKTAKEGVKDRSFWEKFISCPIEIMGIDQMPIFFKDRWNDFTNVLMSGHEFLFLINTINLINALYIGTKSVFMAIFITMFISRLVLKNIADFSVKRNISKNTLINDQLFN